MLYTTLNAILACGPCGQREYEDGSLSGWLKLLNGLGKDGADDEPLPFTEILRINGLDDALWACRSAPNYDKEWRLFAVWCARQVQHLMTDQQSIDALDVAERHANGDASDAELAVAGDAARAAAWDAAWAAAMAVAGDSAWDAARDAAWDAAWAAARSAAGAAAWAAAGAAQSAKFAEICSGEGGK